MLKKPISERQVLSTPIAHNEQDGILGATESYITISHNIFINQRTRISMNTQYAVCHLQRASGNDSGMSCHIERKNTKGETYIPENADKSRTHLNRELIKFPDGVNNRTSAIQYRLYHAGLQRKVANNQTKAIRIILSGTHEQMMKIEADGNLDKWIAINLAWLKKNFGEDNLVSCCLHMGEKTPHLHATVVPIVIKERKRREREGEKKYKTKSHGPRLSADDVMSRYNMKKYQDSYGVAMNSFGLERGIVGSTAKHKSNDTYYKEQMLKYEDDIAKLQTEVEKNNEGKNTLLALFGKGDLAKAKKEIQSKDDEIAKLKEQIHLLESSKAKLIEKHIQEIVTLKNGYQREITTAIRRAETSEASSQDKERQIKNQEQRISQLERKAYPERYRLSSGAVLDHIFVPNYLHPSLHIWTKVGNELFDDVKYDVDYKAAQQHFKGIITDEEFVNAVFEPFEQVNEIQTQLLGTAFVAMTGGPTQAHVGTSGGGSQSELPWGEKEKNRKNARRR